MEQDRDQDIKNTLKERVHEKRWDALLARLYLATKEFPMRAQNESLPKEQRLNLNNISTETRLLLCGHIQENIPFLQANYRDIPFSLGGYLNQSFLPDGEPFNTLAIALWIQNNHVLTLLYHDRLSEGNAAKTFDLISVEHLVENPMIDELLLNLENEMGKSREMQKIELLKTQTDYPSSWLEIYY